MGNKTESNNNIIIRFGTKKGVFNTFVFSYSHVQNININLYNKGIEMIIPRTTSISKIGDIENEFYRSIIIKTLLIYLFSKKTIPAFKKYTILFHSNKKSIPFSSIHFLTDVKRKIPALDYSIIINDILNNAPSNYPNNVVSAINFIVAVNRKYEYDKFSCYWISFNAFIKQFSMKKNEQESLLLNRIIEIFDPNSSITIKKETRDKIFLNFYPSDENSAYMLLKEKLKEQSLNFPSNFKLFIMVHLSYYLRCIYFHGETNVPFINYCMDNELLRIKLCNDYLYEFLSENITKKWGELKND